MISTALVRHELAHALGSLFSGCSSATVQAAGPDGAFTSPAWGDDATPEAIATCTAAGLLYSDGVDTSDDEMVLACFTAGHPELVAELLRPIEAQVRSAVDGLGDEHLAGLADALARGDYIEVQRPGTDPGWITVLPVLIRVSGAVGRIFRAWCGRMWLDCLSHWLMTILAYLRV